jgi:hypothetical protein
MASQIDQLRRQFNGMSTTQKAQFINNLRLKLKGSKNAEYINFLDECAKKYNAELRGGTQFTTTSDAMFSEISLGREFQMNAPGRIFLLVTGILYIVFGAFGVLTALIGAAASQAVRGFGIPGIGMDLNTLALIAGVMGGYQIFIGIMGVVYHKKINMASTLMIFGIIDLTISIITILVMYSGTTAILSLFSLAIPICYIIGAYKNKTA